MDDNKINKIVSGGQTGVDRAALDVALKLHIPHGGWCPRGRLSEDGSIPMQYLLRETKTADYAERTQSNVRDSDATLILVPKSISAISDGTSLTIATAKQLNKPHRIIELDNAESVKDVANWLWQKDIRILNIAGPRESTCPGIYQASKQYLETLFEFLLSEDFLITCRQ